MDRFKDQATRDIREERPTKAAGQYRIRFKWSDSGAYDIQAGEFHDEG